MFAHLEETYGSVATFLEAKCNVKPSVFSKLYTNLAAWSLQRKWQALFFKSAILFFNE
jgi:hypothetical protein